MTKCIRCLCCNQPIVVPETDTEFSMKCPRTGRAILVKPLRKTESESKANSTQDSFLRNESHQTSASHSPGKRNRKLLIAGGVIGLPFLCVILFFAVRGIVDTFSDRENTQVANDSQPSPSQTDQVDPPHLKTPSDTASDPPAPTRSSEPKADSAKKSAKPDAPKDPDSERVLTPLPAEVAANLIKNNELLPVKAMPGKTFDYQLPKVKSAHFQLQDQSNPIGLSLSKEGKLSWTPRLGQRAGTYTVKLKISNDGSAPPPSNHSFTRAIRIVLEENPENALALPKFGGWVMLPDGVTLIISVPESKKLLFIDTVNNKITKEVEVSFIPDLLAVQRNRLFVSARSVPKSEIHILDLSSCEDKKTIPLSGKWPTTMVCHHSNGSIYVVDGQTLISIDPNDGSSQIVLLEPGKASAKLPSINGVRRYIDLAIDQKSENVIYGIVEVTSTNYGWKDTPPTFNDFAFLIKFSGTGKHLLSQWVEQIAPTSSLGGYETVRVSTDGKMIGAIIGATCADGSPGISLVPASGVLSQSKVAVCGDHPGDLAFHPILDIGAALQNKEKQTVLHVFDCKTLTETTISLLADNPNSKEIPAKRLLAFGSRGTKLLYYDPLAGYLRSLSISLTDKDRDELAHFYADK